MSMTQTQKILARHARLDAVRAGQLILADLDLVLGNDITAPVAIREFGKFGKAAVFDRDKVALVPDHFTPNKDIKAAEQCACLRTFAREQAITIVAGSSLTSRYQQAFSAIGRNVATVAGDTAFQAGIRSIAHAVAN